MRFLNRNIKFHTCLIPIVVWTQEMPYDIKSHMLTVCCLYTSLKCVYHKFIWELLFGVSCRTQHVYFFCHKSVILMRTALREIIFAKWENRFSLLNSCSDSLLVAIFFSVCCRRRWGNSVIHAKLYWQFSTLLQCQIQVFPDHSILLLRHFWQENNSNSCSKYPTVNCSFIDQLKSI